MSPAPAVGDVREHALDLHRRTLVADLHSHVLIGAGYLGFGTDGRPGPTFSRWNPLRNLFDLVDLARAHEGGVGVLVCAAFPFPRPFGTYATRTEALIATLKRLVDRDSGRAALVATADEAERVRASRRLAVMLAVEGGHALDGRLENLERLRAAGCVYLTLTHFVNNALSAAATDPRGGGLTPLGRDAVREMNRLGILVDVTHCSLRAKREALEMSEAPVIYSHTGLRRYVDAERMTTDEEIRLVAEKGGVVGILLSPWFLKGRRRAGVPDVVDCIEHVISVAGPDHVAIGSDFDSGLPPPDGLRDIRDYPEITVEMVRRGFDEATIAKVWGGNFLRVLRAIGR